MTVKRFTLCLILLICVGGLIFRLPRLEMRTVHGDEANQMIRFKILFEEGRYEYDPVDNHGPTLYYLTLPIMWLSGVKDFADTSTWQFRLLTALFGTATLLWYLGVRDGVGSVAAVFGALLCAISPPMVFYSRYYIQEPLLVFFTFGTIVAGWRYTQAKSTRAALGWMIVAGLCVGLMHATKETWVIAAAAMGGAAAMTVFWARLVDGRRTAVQPMLRPRMLLAGLAACVMVAVVFYTSFFTDSRGPLQSILTYKNYIVRGTDGTHDHPFGWYLKTLWGTRSESMYAKVDPVHTEAVLLVLAGIGVVAALWRGRGEEKESQIQNLRFAIPNLGFARFVAFYTILATLGYALIRYKTPWCMMTFVQGMTLLAGLGAAAIIRMFPHWSWRVVATVAVLAPVLFVPLRSGTRNASADPALLSNQSLLAQSYRLNFQQPFFNDERRNPYLYSHSSTDMLRVVSRLEQLAAAHPEGRGMLVKFLTSDYWPLPYYLRRFTQVGYFGRIVDDAAAPYGQRPMAYRPVIVTSGAPEVIAEVPWRLAGPTFSARYRSLCMAAWWCPVMEIPRDLLERSVRGRYQMEISSLRWGTLIAVWVDRDLWQKMVEARRK